MKKLYSLILAGVLTASMFLSGCAGFERNVIRNEEIKDETIEGVNTGETSTLGIDPKSKDFESQLEDGEFYVVHDGIYYPTYIYVRTSDEDLKDYVEPSRQCYFTTENEINIPTLYEGDRLIYYNSTGLVDWLSWERYYDMGYTVGVYNIQEMTSGRMWLNLEDDDHECIIPDSELYAIYDLKAEQVLLDKIGGVQITSDFVEDGIIKSTQKSRTYDLEVYNGTYYQHYKTTANIHAFKAYELFASIEYTPLQDWFYEIDIPEYFVSGYYMIDNWAMFRYVKGDSWSEDTDFNEQLLYPYVDKNSILYDEKAYVAPSIYSTYEPLNKFRADEEGHLGYVPEDQEEEQVDAEIGSIVLKEATIKNIDLWFPKGKTCTIKITSKSKETSGDIYVTLSGSTKFIDYNRIDNVYEGAITGRGEKGTLTVSGLWKSYDVELVNCEQYNGQDLLENAEGGSESPRRTRGGSEEQPAEESSAAEQPVETQSTEAPAATQG